MLPRLLHTLLFSLSLALSGVLSGAVASPVAYAATGEELQTEIAAKVTQVPEFAFIAREASRLGVRVWLFGGTAAAFGHYVKWDHERRAGDARYVDSRFDYDSTQIYRANQDLDLVVDGDEAQIQELERAILKAHPHLQGRKSLWEIRPLRTKRGDKEPLLDSADYLNQHTDSNSTGMIELTRSAEPAIRDLRDWHGTSHAFLQDLAAGTLHYYYSPLHETTGRFRQGLNPPILSAIRYLTKAFQYGLRIPEADRARILEVIHGFDPARDLKSDYVRGWIEKNGKKLLQNAVDVEYARKMLDELGLAARLRAALPASTDPASLWVWLGKEPLRTRALGTGDGATAKSLGLAVVSHETSSFEAYESILRSPVGEPNVLISRAKHPGEYAVHGDGFYTRIGREGARGTGLTIRFTLDPNAREGTDFKRVGVDFVLILNRQAIRVVPESLNLTPTQYFELLASESITGAERGYIETVRRRLRDRLIHLDSTDVPRIIELLRIDLQQPAPKEGPSPVGFGAIWREWLRTQASHANPKLYAELLNSTKYNDFITYRTDEFMKWPEVPNHPELVGQLIDRTERRYGISSIARALGSDPRWVKHPDLVQRILDRQNPGFDRDVASNILNHPAWGGHPELLRTLVERNLPELDSAMIHFPLGAAHWQPQADLVEKIMLRSEGSDHQKIISILSRPHWKRPDWLWALIKRHPKQDDFLDGIAEHLLTKPHWADQVDVLEYLIEHGGSETHDALGLHTFMKAHWANRPDLVLKMIRKGNEAGMIRIAGWALTETHWADHPELVEELIRLQSGNAEVMKWLGFTLNEPHWQNQPRLRAVCRGTPAIGCLKDAFDRGFTLAGSPASCLERRLSSLAP